MDSQQTMGASRFPAGAHLMAPRAWYAHHGIATGRDTVIHYRGRRPDGSVGPIEEVAVDVFAAGARLEVVPHQNARFAPCEVVARARSRLGEDQYSMLWNNCEHLCEWAITGRARSTQARAWPRFLLLAAYAIGVRMLAHGSGAMTPGDAAALASDDDALRSA